MKITNRVFISSLTVILLLAVGCSSSSTPDPEVVPLLEKTINGYLAALESKDLDGSMRYLAESEDRARLQNTLSIVFNMNDSWEFSNIDIEVISQGSKKAKAKVERDITTTTEGETTEEHRVEIAELVLIEGEWLIKSME